MSQSERKNIQRLITEAIEAESATIREYKLSRIADFIKRHDLAASFAVSVVLS